MTILFCEKRHRKFRYSTLWRWYVNKCDSLSKRIKHVNLQVRLERPDCLSVCSLFFISLWGIMRLLKSKIYCMQSCANFNRMIIYFFQSTGNLISSTHEQLFSEAKMPLNGCIPLLLLRLLSIRFFPTLICQLKTIFVFWRIGRGPKQ